MRQAHLDLLGFVYGREPPAIDSIKGNTMVDRYFMPLGFMFAYFEPEGVVSVHAHFGKWLRIYPKDILRSVKGVMDELRAMGVTKVYTFADETVEGSRTLVDWFGGVDTGQRNEFGPVFEFDLTKTPI